MIPAGRRDARVAFERASVVYTDHGDEVPSWALWSAALASVRFGTSAERRQAASEGGSQTATFRVLATAKTRAVTMTDRAVFAGSAWDIEGIAPIGRTEIEFTAVRGAVVVSPDPPPNDVGILDFSDANNSALLALFGFAAAPTGEGGIMDFSEPDNSGLLAVL